MTRRSRSSEPRRPVPQGTGDGTIGAGPEGPIDELGEGVPRGRGRVHQVLRQQLPPVVVGGVQLGIRGLEERDVLGVPVPIPIVPPFEALELCPRVQHVTGRVHACPEKTGEEKKREEDAVGHGLSGLGYCHDP